MDTSYISAILAITSLSFSLGTMAKNMSKSEYQAAEKNTLAEYKSANDLGINKEKKRYKK